MSVIRPRHPEDPLLVAAASLTDGEAGRFEAARAESMADEIVRVPGETLDAYGTNRTASSLFSLLARARRIREAVDRLVFVASGPTEPAMRLLFETCCHPFHNDLDRGERGGRPRLFFAGGDFDGDAFAGLLDLLDGPRAGGRDDLLDRFGVVAVGGGDPDGTVAAAMHLLRPAIERRGGPAEDRLAELPCCGASPFTAATLLPAAIVGIDVVRLLEGAVAMNVRFAEAPPATNPVAFLLRPAAGTGGCRLACRETRRLGSLRAWHERLGAAAVGPTADVDVSIGEPRRDPIADPRGVSWQLRATAGRDAAAIRLPRLDEHAVGQLLQMLAIATVVGRRFDPDIGASA